MTADDKDTSLISYHLKLQVQKGLLNRLVLLIIWNKTKFPSPILGAATFSRMTFFTMTIKYIEQNDILYNDNKAH